MPDDNASIQQQLEQSILKGPHVVIVGAGATIASIPNGDKNGRKSSVMNNFVKNLGMEDLMAKVSLQTQSLNIEDIYSELYERPEYDSIRIEMEQRIFSYFDSLEIPDSPTAYDYLILSLRKKDWIFSFNWDDLILQAYARCYRITTDLPELVFLHGNVNVAFCNSCGKPQRLDYGVCCECGKELAPVQLLYPVKQKDYTSSTYIKKAWETLEVALDEASILTIFGYSAPKTDSAAKELMKKAFANRLRWYDQMEVIDIADRETIYTAWEDFITAVHDHISIHSTIFDGTLMAEFPRRSVEGYVKRNYNGWWGASGVSLSECGSMEALKQLMQPLLVNEQKGDTTVVSQRDVQQRLNNNI